MKVKVSGVYYIKIPFSGTVEIDDDWKNYYDTLEEAAEDECCCGNVDVIKCDNPGGQAEWEDVELDNVEPEE